MSPEIVLAPRRIVVPLRGAREMGRQPATEPVATIQAPIGVQPISEFRIALPIAALPRDVAPTVTNRDATRAGPVASDRPVHRQSFRRSLARVCD
jgi:hypothetical protein